MKAPRKKKQQTYRQNWRAYKANEKDRFLELLPDLCASLPIAPLIVGRPPIPLPDSVFLAILKVYEMRSGRRSTEHM